MSWALHHIGYLTGDLEAEAARWQADFGYECDGPVHTDPAQTAKVCFLRLPGADHWLELVTPDGPASKLANALRQQTAFHHLCYEVPDVIAAVATLRERGWLPLGSPAPAVAFGGRPVAWVMNERRALIEIVEAGPGPYQQKALRAPGASPR
jgi:methylmalonyl-CoA/ethylmalonyl-CoA epimerase